MIELLIFYLVLSYIVMISYSVITIKNELDFFESEDLWILAGVVVFSPITLYIIMFMWMLELRDTVKDRNKQEEIAKLEEQIYNNTKT